MSVAYDLQQILPPPLAVARDIVNTLTLHYEQRWLYGPNIYRASGGELRARDHRASRLPRRSRFRSGLLVGRIRVPCANSSIR